MLTRSKTLALVVFALIVSALLVSSSAVAHTEGIYNPTANSVGNFEGIDSNGAAATPLLTLGGTPSYVVSNASATVSYGTMTYGSGCTRVIAAIGTIENGTSVSSVTVNGSSLSLVASSNIDGFGGTNSTEIWESAGGVSGSSGAVSATWSAVTGHSAVALYCLTTTTPAANNANTGSQAFGTTISTTLNIPASGGGVVFLSCASANCPVGPTETNWTADAVINTFFIVGRTTVTGAGQTITANWSASDRATVSAASWGP